jgi:nicotinamide-nucleotide amidase
MTAAILTIGDELLNGQVVNGNAAWIGERLTAYGVTVERSVVVGDDQPAITWALTELLQAAEVVICTGGLGPTHDDLTREALAHALGRPLSRREELLGPLQDYYSGRGRETPRGAEVMADVPEGFEPIENPVGVAPGLWFSGELEGRGERMIAALPGVPHEMRVLMDEAVLPRLIERQGEAAAVQTTLLTAGLGESAVVERLGDLGPWLSDNLRLAILPKYGEVRLRVTALGASNGEARRRLSAFLDYARQQLGDLVVGEGKTDLAAALGQLLRDRGLTIAVAESCTGGGVGAALTSVPGSSDYFLGGHIVYSNQSKVSVLGVDSGVLRAHGAVSEPVAVAMAEGAREALGADLAVSTTGVAGPGGGTPTSPVGTVWIACADAHGHRAVRLQLGGDRLTINRLSVTAALDLVRRRVLRG